MKTGKAFYHTKPNGDKLKILYLSHSGQLYGAEQSLLLLLKNLDRSWLSPLVVLPEDGPLKAQLTQLSIPVIIIPTIRAWLTRRSGLMRLLHHLGLIYFLVQSVWTLTRLIQRQKIDLVHTNSLAVIDGALAAWLLGIPHAWHAREILDQDAPHKYLFGPCVAISIILRLSKRVIAISDAVANCFYYCKNTQKIVTVYNAISLAEFGNVNGGNLIRQEFNISNNVPVVAQAGNLTPVKGCEDFVHAAAQVHQVMPEVIFLLVGGTPYPDYKQKLVDLVDSYHLNNAFFLTGFRQDMPAVFSAVDLLVLASHYEPFGRVLIEAMGTGKPVVGTRVGGIPEIIVDRLTGILVPPNSPDELAQAIISILNQPKMAEQMGRAGQEQVQERFSLNNHVKAIEKLYKELSGERLSQVQG